MKYSKFLRILAVAIVISLLMVLIPTTPVLAAPVINLSPTSGAIGTEITVTGENFESYAGDYVSVLFNNREIGGGVIPANGTFTVSFRVPDDAAPGRAYVTSEDELGNRLGERRPFIIEEIEVELYPRDGAVGTVVTINGKGFYANERATFYYNEPGVNMGTQTASSIGEVIYSFAIPESIAGEHEIEAQDALGNSVKADFTVVPSAIFNPASGAAGDEVTVSGTGFGYRSAVAIYLNNIKVATDITDKYGSFEATFNVPVMKPDTYKLKAVDSDDNTAKMDFTIGAGASLSRTMGNVGTLLAISGTGFLPGETVTITYDALEVTTATPNDNGAFSVAFNVPPSIGGNHPITITDGINIIKRIFTMESETPPVPTLLLPEEAVKAKAETYFDWEDVTDDSLPVTYTLQIATNADFTSIVLKKELTDSGYTIAKEQKLEPTKKEAPYYWRVKATDSASNESEWSTPMSFYIGASFAVPSGVIYTLIVLGVLGLGFLCFWLGRRTAYYRRPL